MTLEEEYLNQCLGYECDCTYNYGDYNNYSNYHEYSDGPETGEDD